MFQSPMFAVGITLFIGATGVCIVIPYSSIRLLSDFGFTAFFGPCHLFIHRPCKYCQYRYTNKSKRIPVVESELEHRI